MKKGFLIKKEKDYRKLLKVLIVSQMIICSMLEGLVHSSVDLMGTLLIPKFIIKLHLFLQNKINKKAILMLMAIKKIVHLQQELTQLLVSQAIHSSFILASIQRTRQVILTCMEADFECQICIHQINLVVKLELLVVLYLSNNKREIVQKESQIFLNKIRLLGENWQEKL